jgi:glycosyltransferase involved in cell wall biosynthesis
MISIIIPTLNEERSLPSLLDAVCRQGAEYEVIVVDGGSQDRTLEIARRHGVRTLSSPPGRGKGICIGAAASCGEVLFFLHADSTLLPGSLDRISEVLSTGPLASEDGFTAPMWASGGSVPISMCGTDRRVRTNNHDTLLWTRWPKRNPGMAHVEVSYISRRFVFWGKSPTLPEVIQERTRADLAAARQRGRVGGRPKLLTARRSASGRAGRRDWRKRW